MGLDLHYQYGQTLLDPDELADLNIDSITTRKELDEFEQQNIEEALAWLYGRQFSPEDLLTEKFVKQLHSYMFGNVWKWAGQFRRTDKNIGVPYHKIGLELKYLLDDMKYWLAHQSMLEDEFCIRAKHRIVSIHCFPNGNGRHSRVWADVLRQHIFGGKYYSWSGHSLTSVSAHRQTYIQALRMADEGNLIPLLDFAKSK